MKMQLLSKEYINDIIELYHQLLPKENIFFNKKIAEVLDIIDKDMNYNIIVGIVNGKAVATCTLIIIPNITHDARPYGIIENVITHCEFRGKGYGHQVLEQAKKIAKENRCHKIMVQTRRKEEKIFEFYRKAGFSDDISKGFWVDL